MSEHERLENANRKGKKAFWDGVPLSANPMRAGDSRVFWEVGWQYEQYEKEARDKISLDNEKKKE